MHSYSYEMIKDEHSMTLNMSILNKINGEDATNGNIGRNFINPKTAGGCNTGMMTSIGHESLINGTHINNNEEQQRNN